MKRMTTLEDVVTFIKAGKARFTLRSAKTQDRFTYRVSLSPDGEVWFVSLMTGPDNEAHYSYMGIINKAGEFRRTAKSKVEEESSGYKAFAWTWKKLTGGVLPDELEVWHEGRCGKCGRLLTVPESIDRGIGPECAKYFGSQVEMIYG
jgi:hypothetical protein